MSDSGRPAWDFEYRLARWPVLSERCERDLIVATEARVPEAVVQKRLRSIGARQVHAILERPPLFWWRALFEDALPPERVATALGSADVRVRYVASTGSGSQRWAPPLRVTRAMLARPTAWSVRLATTPVDREEDGFWFLRADGGGIGIDRRTTGTGAGTRLAVIDDDAEGVSALDLDAEVLVDLKSAPRSHAHGVRMVGWAVGAPRTEPPFSGVAPDASPRLYLIPKPSGSVVSLPLAIVRAVSDGADVVVCATYVEGSWSPMLDDALAFAERCGRRGRGAVVVLPTGRETSSPPGSVHASLTLAFGDPAADPRVVCVAPGSRRGGWFFYRDRKGRARPFANRGPSVRLLAPGDDIADPTATADRLAHAESSGASAIAAGLVALVMAANPSLRMHEILALLEMTAKPVPPVVDPSFAPLADPYDARPLSADPDGHNAKHGYGAAMTLKLVLAATDPIEWALVRIGEVSAARAYRLLRTTEPAVSAAYSIKLAHWCVRALISDARASHAARAIARHARLLSVARRRREGIEPGSLTKQVALLLRGFLERASTVAPPPALRVEINAHIALCGADPQVESRWLDLAETIFSTADAPISD